MGGDISNLYLAGPTEFRSSFAYQFNEYATSYFSFQDAVLFGSYYPFNFAYTFTTDILFVDRLSAPNKMNNKYAYVAFKGNYELNCNEFEDTWWYNIEASKFTSVSDGENTGLITTDFRIVDTEIEPYHFYTKAVPDEPASNWPFGNNPIILGNFFHGSQSL